MATHTYLCPMGLLAGPAAALSVEAGVAGWLAGGPLAFSQIDVGTRQVGKITCRPVPFNQFLTGADVEQRAQVARLSAPRPDVAGLSLARPLIMGVVNVTPDSFSDGGRFTDAEAAVEHGLALLAAGADILDIGGESTRPGSDAVAEDEELARVLPVVRGLARQSKACISIDSRKANVMRAAAEAGARMINDVSALTYDPESLQVVADNGVSVVLMHARGDPKTMQDDPRYEDVLLDVYDALSARIEACLAAGIASDKIIVDPGIGFGKTLTHNLQLMEGLSLLHGLGVPVMFGASRKAFIGKLSGVERADKRMVGSVAAGLAAIAQGAQIVRVHDVAEMRQALNVWESARSGHAV